MDTASRIADLFKSMFNLTFVVIALLVVWLYAEPCLRPTLHTPGGEWMLELDWKNEQASECVSHRSEFAGQFASVAVAIVLSVWVVVMTLFMVAKLAWILWPDQLEALGKRVDAILIARYGTDGRSVGDDERLAVVNLEDLDED